jgi:hypothetical protein
MELVLETSKHFSELTRLLAQENFNELTSLELPGHLIKRSDSVTQIAQYRIQYYKHR